jgi:hypothetical protein
VQSDPGALELAVVGTHMLLLRTRAMALYRACPSTAEAQLAGKHAVFVGFAAQQSV